MSLQSLRAMVVALVTLLAPSLPSVCRAQVCMGNVADDFDGTQLSPLWQRFSTTNWGNGAVTGGRLVFASHYASSAAVITSTTLKVCGDFDASVEFFLIDFPVPESYEWYGRSRAAGIQVRRASDGQILAELERYATQLGHRGNPSTQNYLAWSDTPLNSTSSWAATTDLSGRLRMVRSGDSLSYYYWDGSWVLLRTSIIGSDDVRISLFSQTDDPEGQNVQFDNFSLSSEAPEVAGSIGVYFDAAGTGCQGTIHPGTPGMVYILVKPAGATADGIAGAEFRFTGLPLSWHVFPVANPEPLAMGDPFGDGVVAGMPCQSPQGGVVLLYSVGVLADAEEPDVVLGIECRDPPSNPMFPCPLLLACDDPVFTKYCVGTQSCFVNSSTSAGPCGSALAVDQKTWTGVKQLYR